MTDEFNNRIDAQRKIIQLINRFEFNCPLVGLSKDAIDFFKLKNGLDDNEPLYITIVDIASKLFFLANKSQEQISNDYKSLSKEISNRIEDLKVLLESSYKKI